MRIENKLGEEPGVWDPMGCTRVGDIDDSTRRRECEVKNGRVMFATLGPIVPEYLKFPGTLAKAEDMTSAYVRNGPAALKALPLEEWLQWIALCGGSEIGVNGVSNSGEPGGYGKDQLEVTRQSIQDPDECRRTLALEIATGRPTSAGIGICFANFLGVHCHVRAIAEIELSKVAQRLEERNISIVLSARCKEHIFEEGFNLLDELE